MRGLNSSRRTFTKYQSVCTTVNLKMEPLNHCTCPCLLHFRVKQDVHLLYSDKETHAKRSECLYLYEYVYAYHFFCNGLHSLTLAWMAWWVEHRSSVLTLCRMERHGLSQDRAGGRPRSHCRASVPVWAHLSEDEVLLILFTEKKDTVWETWS